MLDYVCGALKNCFILQGEYANFTMDFELIFYPPCKRFSKKVFTVIFSHLLGLIWYTWELFSSKNVAVRSQNVRSVRDLLCTYAPKKYFKK